MRLNLVKYKKTESRFRSLPFVKITSKGFRFNLSCYESFLKNKPFIELFWDNDNKVVGIKLLVQETDDSFPVRVYRTKSPVILVNCKRFVEDCGILKLLDEKANFPIEEGEEGMLIIKLKGVT